MRLSEKAHLSFDKSFDRPFDKLTVLSKVEGLTMLSNVEASKGCITLIPRPVKFSLRETAEPI